jgi:putative membrane protein
MLAALVAFAHHFAAFSLFAALVVELVLIRGELTIASARKLLRADMIFGIAAGAILVIGFVRVKWLEKTPAYYAHSGTFIAKMALFALIGLISIYPTMKMLSWRKALAANQLPTVDAGLKQRLAMLIHIELTLLAALILCAALMAKGVGQLT